MALLAWWLETGFSRLFQASANCRLNISGSVAGFFQYLGRQFVGQNQFKKQFSHIPLQFLIQWKFWSSLHWYWTISHPWLQLKSFIQPRTNLSPFTKDFRVWETPIETQTIYQASPAEAVSCLVLKDKKRNLTCSGICHQTFPNEFFHQFIWHLTRSSTHTKRWGKINKWNGKVC